MIDADLPRHVEAFRGDGFVHLAGVLDPAEVEAFAVEIDRAVEVRTVNDLRSLAERSPYEQSFVQCQYLWEQFPAVRGLTFHPTVGRIAAALLGAERVRLFHDQALYKAPGGRETDAHQDHPYWPIVEPATLTVWIPLCDIDEAMGCMGYVPGSHRGALEFTNIFTAPGSGVELMARQAAAPIFVPCKRGDVIFHDGRTVHLAHRNRSDAPRKAYTAIYFKDGCTRAAAARHHPSLDRSRIAVGAAIDGDATPIAWPLPGGVFPSPAPWPDSTDVRFERARQLGIIPGAGV